MQQYTSVGLPGNEIGMYCLNDLLLQTSCSRIGELPDTWSDRRTKEEKKADCDYAVRKCKVLCTVLVLQMHVVKKQYLYSVWSQAMGSESRFRFFLLRLMAHRMSMSKNILENKQCSLSFQNNTQFVSQDVNTKLELFNGNPAFSSHIQVWNSFKFSHYQVISRVKFLGKCKEMWLIRLVLDY